MHGLGRCVGWAGGLVGVTANYTNHVMLTLMQPPDYCPFHSDMTGYEYFVLLWEMSSEERLGPYTLDYAEHNMSEVHLSLYSPLIMENAVYNYSIQLAVGNITISEGNVLCK